MQEGESLMVLMACGAGQAAVGGLLFTAAGPGDFRFRGGPVDTEVGIYRACWCRGACTLVADFFVEAGILTVNGPFQDHAPVAEAPWSVAEWAVALRFDNLRATVLVLLLSDTPLRVLWFQMP